MILVNKCYEVHDGSEECQGEAQDRGFEFKDREFSFRDLVSEMKEYSETSSYPACASDWLISSGENNYRTGEETFYSLHYSRDNKARSAKYWEKAMKKAGLLK